jgi:hypothetical protein
MSVENHDHVHGIDVIRSTNQIARDHFSSNQNARIQHVFMSYDFFPNVRKINSLAEKRLKTPRYTLLFSAKFPLELSLLE